MWISEAENDKHAMLEDLKMLIQWNDDYILTSNSTNSYIGKNSKDFNEKCEELIELNKELCNGKN